MARERHGRTLRPAAAAAFFAGVFAVLLLRVARAPGQDPNTTEINAQTSEPVFSLRIQHNEVVVRVVVRDAQGRAVSSLKQDDFHIFDNRKPQIITHFSLENHAAPAGGAPPVSTVSASGDGLAPPTKPSIAIARRFMAVYFDDVHLELGDLYRARDAADRYLADNLQPGDRAGLFTSSGQNEVDFTDDHQKLRAALLELRPHSVSTGRDSDCPQLSVYQAYKMAMERDPYATQVAYEEAFECNCNASDPAAVQQQCAQREDQVADNLAMQVYEIGATQSEAALRGIEAVCRRMGNLPGQRSMVVVSPGFLSIDKQFNIDRIVDMALRENVVLNTLDGRGLYAATPLGDASKQVIFPAQRADLTGDKVRMQIESMRTDDDVLEMLADDSGGVFFHNSNDFNDGFRRTGAFPETYYMLAFAPQDLKLDGHLHDLRVALASNPNHYTIQARHGYFAPNKPQDAADAASEEIESLVFSQEELQTIPLRVHTQFFKASSGQSHLAVVTHVDVGGLQFRKADGRNVDNLTVVTALFDHSGNYVAGMAKTFEFKLRDETRTRLSSIGLNSRADLAVKPGTYLVRTIIKETESTQVSALNSEVEVP